MLKVAFVDFFCTLYALIFKQLMRNDSICYKIALFLLQN